MRALTVSLLGSVVIILAGVLWWARESEKHETVVPSSTASSVAVATTEAPAEVVGSSQPVASPAVLSLAGLQAREYRGTNFRRGQILAQNEAYTRYYITYESDGLTISGIMNMPKGEGPFPVLMLNHGFIDPAIYTNGRGLKREQDYLARQGFVVVHPDYRNHADSGDDPLNDVNLRTGYVADAMNAVTALQAAQLDSVDTERVGMLGHSMGGGVTINAAIIKPELVDAMVLFAPVSANQVDNFNRWLVRRPEVAQRIIALFGAPKDSQTFWHNISAINFLDQLRSPVMIHHGDADADVPIAWSDTLAATLEKEGKTVMYHRYPGQPHEFTTDWTLVMQRTTAFFKEHLSG